MANKRMMAATTSPPRPRPSRIIFLAVAFFVSVKFISSSSPFLRVSETENNDSTTDIINLRPRRRRRLLGAASFNDPKTVTSRETTTYDGVISLTTDDPTGVSSTAAGVQFEGNELVPPPIAKPLGMHAQQAALQRQQQQPDPSQVNAAVTAAMNPQELADFNAIAAELESANHDGLLGNGAVQQQPMQPQQQPQQQAQQQAQPNPNEGIIAPYTIENALATTQGFRYTLFFFVYDSSSDSFVIVHNVPGCDHGCSRIHRVASIVAQALRKNFPQRFQGKGKSDDWAVMMSTGDAPRIHNYCLRADRENYCNSATYAPILQFGSVFANKDFLPSMIAMPLPVRPHIPCFLEWQNGKKLGENGVCQDLQPNLNPNRDQSPKSGFIFGQELGIIKRKGSKIDESYWNDLIPQIIWRGTDFVFLHTMFQEMRAPEYQLDIAPYENELLQSATIGSGSPEDDRRWAIQTLWRMGDKLLPRWRGVLMTSEAELEAREFDDNHKNDGTGKYPKKLPWINVKFASVNVKGVKIPASENEEYQRLAKLGISAIGERVDLVTQAKYKYHIDLGGGGGTTWTGTIEKLAMPGVLFHHVTPTADWFHSYLTPWEHYIPVRADLTDLREKYEWAETNQEQARRISENGTEFVRWMGSEEGFAKLYEERLVAPLRDAIEAYEGVPQSLMVLINQRSREMENTVGGVGFAIVGRCDGRSGNSCEVVS